MPIFQTIFVYYRWRLYSVLQGDDRQKWRLDRFRMFEGGSWWQPPPHALFELGMPLQLYETAYVPTKKRRAAGRMGKRRSRHSSGESEEENEEERERRKKRALLEDMEREERQRKMKGILNGKDRQELEELLRNLTPQKTAIGDAMIWCLDHAECSKEIALCIFESLCIKETPLHKKIAHIFLISDILANCSARIKDAFYFRQHLGDHLQKIFIQLNETLESIESRLKAEQFRQRVMLCFRNWEDHALYPTQDLIQWQNIFLGLLKNSVDDSSIDGEPMAMENEIVDDELDGVPLPEDEDLDGVPMGDDELQQQNVDESDLDGVPMDDSESSIAEKAAAEDNRFTTESWSTVVESPPDEINSKKEEKNVNPTKSKWEALETSSSRWADHHQTTKNISSAFLEEDLEEKDALAMKRHKLSKLSPSPDKEEIERKSEQRRKKEDGGGHDDEERRRILREIEMKVVKFQDELEADGAKSQAQIQGELNKYRQKLMAKIEEKTVAATDKKESNGKQKRHGKSPMEEKSRRNERSSSRRRGSDHHSSRRGEGGSSSKYSRESDRYDGRHRRASREGRNGRSSERRRRRSRSRSGRR